MYPHILLLHLHARRPRSPYTGCSVLTCCFTPVILHIKPRTIFLEELIKCNPAIYTTNISLSLLLFTMIFTTTFSLALLFLTHVANALPHAERSTTVRATFDTTYDNKAGSLNSVACSNGANGLARFPTFGNIPTFPFIGGAPNVTFNSPNCGGCWRLTSTTTGGSLIMTAIDSSGSGFNLAQEAFVTLNGGQVGQGTLDVIAEQIDPHVCGLV